MSPGEFRMLFAFTHQKRGSGAPPVIDPDEALELALLGAAETACAVAQAGLMAAIAPESVLAWRLRLAATEAVRRALRADHASRGYDRVENIVEQVDRLDVIGRPTTQEMP